MRGVWAPLCHREGVFFVIKTVGRETLEGKDMQEKNERIPGFGLVYVDYPTQRRIIKDGGYWYRDTIAANGVAS